MTKKTRELPNLTECHCCHLRLDLAKSNNKLHILYSEWRIVLLCTKCLARVQSTELCSYCFTASSADCFSCRQCKRRVHRHCDSDHRSSSSSSVPEEVSICGDCWVSESLARWRRSRNNNMSCVRAKAAAAELGLEGSRVWDRPGWSGQNGECLGRLEDAVVEDDGALKEGQGSCSNGIELDSFSPPEDFDTCNARLDPYYFKYRRRKGVAHSFLTYKRRSIVDKVDLLTYKRRGTIDHRFMFTYKRRRAFDHCTLTYKRRRPGIISTSIKEEEEEEEEEEEVVQY